MDGHRTPDSATYGGLCNAVQKKDKSGKLMKSESNEALFYFNSIAILINTLCSCSFLPDIDRLKIIVISHNKMIYLNKTSI